MQLSVLRVFYGLLVDPTLRIAPKLHIYRSILMLATRIIRNSSARLAAKPHLASDNATAAKDSDGDVVLRGSKAKGSDSEDVFEDEDSGRTAAEAKGAVVKSAVDLQLEVFKQGLQDKVSMDMARGVHRYKPGTEPDLA